MFEYINSFCLFWFKKKCIYECIKHDFFCFIIFEECIYECMKFDFLLFYYFWRIHIWIHAIWFSFVSLFLKNAYMNAWNLIWFCFVIFEECIYINAWNLIFFCFIIFEEWIYECMKFDFWRMYVKMHEILCFYYFFLFWMKMHVWMLDILFLIFLDDNAYIKWMKFYFSFFIFLNYNAWNSIFLNNHFRC